MGSPFYSDAADAAAVTADGLSSLRDTDDDLAGIGYEAANPQLHAPLWCEAMQALSDVSPR